MKRLIKEIIWTFKVVAILSVIGIGLNFILEDSTDWNDIKEWIIYNCYFAFPFSLGNNILIDYLNKSFPWNEAPKKRLVWGVIISTIFNVALLILLIMFLATVIEGQPIESAFSRRYAGTYIIALIITLVISLIGYSYFFFKQVEQEKIINEKLRREKVTAELNALRSQVNPHFLFNSFNVLSGLIDEDQKKAQKFLGGLSKIYRYILEQKDENISSLEDEIKFAHQYLDLHKIRFENSIFLDVDIDKTLYERNIPSLSLQLLLENAVKHNAFDTNQPLQIQIKSQGDLIIVSNNIRKRSHLNGSSGIGLKNIAERYKLREINGFNIDESNNQFTVTLPLL